jgi:hypothetical protein
MIRARIQADNVIKMLKKSVQYSSAFTTELNKNKTILNQKVGEESIDAFYDWLDSLARSHPGMLHHVYEWGQVGDPVARLFELGLSVNNRSAVIDTTFLFSDQPASESGHIFEDKARVMEYGESVTVNEIDAEALFFKIDGEEFFRKGPIFIANPGGIEVRGSFVKAFNQFYGSYFTEIHLKSIKFYKYFSNAKIYEKYFASATKGGASSKGKKAALSWIMNAPGGKYGNL